jgi:hypothetical protein
MAETTNRGPMVSAGSLYDGRDETFDGPSIVYQGDGFPDVRQSPMPKDGLISRRVSCFLESPWVITADNIPSAISGAGLAALTATVALTPQVLTTVAPGGAAGVPSLAPVPIVPFGTSTPINVLAIDFGFTTGTTTAGSATIAAVPDSTQFAVGEWICIGGAGNAAKTSSLMTQVVSLASATTITVSPAPLGSLAHAPIGHANLGQPVPPGVVPNGVSMRYDGGLGAFFCPHEGLARVVSVVSQAGGTVVFTINGYDVYMRPMTQTLTANGVTTANTLKAFKYISSIVPATTDAGHTYSFGWGDTFGLNLRADLFEHTDIKWGGLVPVIGTGFTAAVKTNPSTAALGDVRGTVSVATLAAPVGAASNGTLRLVIAQRVTPWQGIFSTPLFPNPLYGVTQV